MPSGTVGATPAANAVSFSDTGLTQGTSYFYRISHVDVKVLPVTNYSSWLSLKPGEGAKCTVEWKGAFYRGYPNNDPPPDLNDDTAVAAMTGVYKAGLGALKKSVESGS